MFTKYRMGNFYTRQVWLDCVWCGQDMKDEEQGPRVTSMWVWCT